MLNSRPAQRSTRRYVRDPWWPPLLTVVPYLMLAALTLVLVFEDRPPLHDLVIDLVLCALAALWLLLMITLHPEWTGRPAIMAVFYVGLIAITGVLTFQTAWFGIFAVVCFPYAFIVLPWPWRLPGVAAAAVLAGTAQAHDVPKTTSSGVISYLIILALNILAMCGLAWADQNSYEQSNRRRMALDELSEAHRRLEESYAENAGLHEQLVDRARRAGVLDERQRMAREIHDTLAQGLTGIVTQLEAAEHAAADPVRWRRHLAAASDLARLSLTEARRSVAALRPGPLEDAAHLSEALADVADRWSTFNSVQVQFTTTGTARPLSAEADTVLLRIAQEALANIAKHAGAGRVGLTLSYLDHEVALDVRDDGRGFDAAGVQLQESPGQGGGSGFGLLAMRQRVESLSGTLQIESEPGLGTAISASLPIPDPALLPSKMLP
ncbi:sensor histidine kinase [Streptomyces sp. DG2A-72]|uniref:sensor histidine kinase n=1 Tax=Streptomyces sp. DG2A-72 TaxID=3051386 RepID=UPI00265BA07C|nr:sensor histidine kinase [Streptomyces sp. DG2A-72]MDO0930220.1 sensor histidine kinase [Streptomyces sp. DG2A-72]